MRPYRPSNGQRHKDDDDLELRPFVPPSLPPLPPNPSVPEQVDWMLAALQNLNQRVVTMTRMVAGQDRRIARLDRSIAELWKTSMIGCLLLAGAILCLCALRWLG
jgi:hypothetical protein